MGLSWHQGPLASDSIGRFLVPGPLPERLLYAEPLRPRMRVRFADGWIADSEDAVLRPGRGAPGRRPAPSGARPESDPARHRPRSHHVRREPGQAAMTATDTTRAGMKKHAPPAAPAISPAIGGPLDGQFGPTRLNQPPEAVLDVTVDQQASCGFSSTPAPHHPDPVSRIVRRVKLLALLDSLPAPALIRVFVTTARGAAGADDVPRALAALTLVM
jgi:hypothetical protein